MMRALPFLIALSLVIPVLGDSGGPDAYGYTWRDSNEPDGPVYSWTDITSTGILIQGLADDNVIGPITMETDHPFYWYSRKNIWIGSNGYVSFTNGNIASPFPTIPTSGGVNDYIAGLTADLNFTGAGNPGQCYLFDDLTQTIISYVNVPFWTSAAPSYTGSNTFQIVLNKVDSSITIHYQNVSGTTQNNDLLIGIESVAGSIGLQHSADIYPASNYAIRFYMPASTDLDIVDATVDYNSTPGSRGRFLSRNGSAFGLITNVLNSGNVDLTNITVQGVVRNLANVTQVTGNGSIAVLNTPSNITLDLNASFTPTTAGIYSYTSTLGGIPNELVTTNNSRTQELVVVDTTLATHTLTYAGATDDGVGLGWDGGNGGVGMYLSPPYYPAYASATTVRIVSTLGTAGFSMKVYDDNGPNGSAGTLLDSVTIAPEDVVVGDMTIPLTETLTIAEGGVYVLWYMNGPNVNIAEDITPPFSLHTYEVLGGTWAEYRDREATDFHIGLQLIQEPVPDIGVSGFFGTAPGQNIEEPITVRTWITNYGTLPASGFAVSYQFADGPILTAPYTGAAVAPGAEVLFSFPQPFDPDQTTTDDLCAWSDWDLDLSQTNDTTCVTVNAFVGIAGSDAPRLQVWPNPTTATILVEGIPAGPCTVAVLDASGRAVLEQRHTASQAPLQLGLAGLPIGAYHIRIVSSGKQLRGPIMLVK
jgi:hypothetical protein